MAAMLFLAARLASVSASAKAVKAQATGIMLEKGHAVQVASIDVKRETQPSFARCDSSATPHGETVNRISGAD